MIVTIFGFGVVLSGCSKSNSNATQKFNQHFTAKVDYVTGSKIIAEVTSSIGSSKAQL